jgi:hypothetical protein
VRTRQIKAERYRAEGQRLRGEAELATNSEIRLQILNIAAQYDRLADSVDSALPSKERQADKP